MFELGVLQVVKGSTQIPEKLLPIDLKGQDALEFSVEEGRVIISLIEMSCPFCSRIGIIEVEGKFICSLCRDSLIKLQKSKRRRNSRKWIKKES